MTAKEIIKRPKAAGWNKLRCDGSHRQVGHPDKPGRVTAAMHGGNEVPRTLMSIERQSRLQLRKRKRRGGRYVGVQAPFSSPHPLCLLSSKADSTFSEDKMTPAQLVIAKHLLAVESGA